MSDCEVKCLCARHATLVRGSRVWHALAEKLALEAWAHPADFFSGSPLFARHTKFFYVKSAQMCLRQPSRLNAILFAFPDHSRTEKFQMCRVCHGGYVVRLFRMKRRSAAIARLAEHKQAATTTQLLLRAPHNTTVSDGTSSRLHELVPLTRRQTARAIQRCVPGS